MNTIELRYEIYKFLVGIGRPAALVNAQLVSPEPGTSCVIEVITEDVIPGHNRRYRVTIEEVT